MTEFKTDESKNSYILIFKTDRRDHFLHVQREARRCVDHEDLQNFNGWIPVDKCLPDRSGKYIVCNRSGAVYQTKFYAARGKLDKPTWGQRDKGKNITHWTFLPLPVRTREDDEPRR